MDYFVALDAGHGILTSGKRTFLFPDGSFMREWEFNSAVMQKVYKKLIPYKEIDVFISNSEKYDVDLDVRVKRINDAWTIYQNKLGKSNVKGVLISIHANAIDTETWNDVANGTATFYHYSNATDKAFAEIIQRNLIVQTGLNPHRGGVVESNFQITRESLITACLCECAFMTNLQEAELLRTDDFREKCATGIVNGLLEYFEIGANKTEAEYKKYNNNIHELKGSPNSLTVKVVDKRIWDITEYTNCTNGTFYWYDDKGKTYATSILIIDGEIIKNEADHYYRFGCPQNVFIIYKNGEVEMRKIYFANELDYKNIKIAVGGVGLRDTTNSNFKYDPASEGFKKGVNKITGKTEDQSGVLAKRNKTVIGYSRATGKVYLLVVRNITHGDLIKLISTGESYDIAASLDGGGSTFMDAEGKYVFEGENGRRIHNIIGFNL